MQENEHLEFRKSLRELREGVISLSAMLNMGHHGTVVFGMDEEGRACGTEAPAFAGNVILSEVRSSIRPLPLSVSVSDGEQEGRRIITAVAEGDDTPYSAYGKYYTRGNGMDIPMGQAELMDFFREKDGRSSSWEKAPSGYGPEDIDGDLLLDCVRNAESSGGMAYVYRNESDTLRRLGLLTDDGRLSNAGWYLFGRGKPVTIREESFPTDSETSDGCISTFRGNILECISEAYSWILNHITFKARIAGLQREKIPEIPKDAIREIVVNSFVHAAYEDDGACFRYSVRRSSVSISNPGTLAGGADTERFASGKTGRRIRNVLIAAVLWRCGYMDALGKGLRRVADLCSRSGTEYSSSSDGASFTFIFRRKAGFLSKQLNDRKTHRPDDRNNSYSSGRKDSLDEKILSLIRKNGRITVPEIAAVTGRPVVTVYRHIRSLADARKVRRKGARKNGSWEITG